MNLYEKLKSYIWFRRKGFSHKVAWHEFKSPLTEMDKIALFLLFLIALAACVVAYSNEIDGELIATQRAAQNNALEAAKMRQLANVNYAEAKLYENITISMLNGSVKRDGRIKTVCILTAGGMCE